MIAAQEAAAHGGFNESDAGLIAIAAGELASNLVKHAGGGTMKLSVVCCGQTNGIEIETEDRGPGILSAEHVLIDGLGYSNPAHMASQQARNFIQDHFSQDLHKLFAGVGRACRLSRGIVMALARFDIATGKVDIDGVGSIEVCQFGVTARPRITIRHGIIGVTKIKPVVNTHGWTADSVLVIYSGGLSRRWE